MARIQLEGILKLIDVDINPAIYQKISRAVSNLPVSFQQTGKAANAAAGQVQGLNATIGRTNKQLSLGSAFATKFLQRMAQFAILLPVFATLNKALQGSVRFMSEFESELLNVVRVNPKEALARIGEISEAALNIGASFGVSAIDVIKSIKIFVQAGNTISESLDKARVAAIATQVSTLDLAQAQEVLIGVQKQFASEALSNQEVLDKLAKVEDLTASDAQDMADAFRTGGNALAFATKDFDYAIALIASLREQTRKSGSELGTFAKTLAPRIFAGGESRNALEQLGVSVEDQTGELRPLQDVLNDTKKAFDGLTQAEQINAAKAIAGVRQFETFIAAIKAADRATQVYAQSKQSSGTADQKLLIVQEKLSYQVDQTIAEFQKLAAELGNAGILDFFKEAIKAARGFAIGLEGAVEVAKTLGVAIAPLIGVGAFKLGQIAFGRNNKNQAPAAAPTSNIISGRPAPSSGGPIVSSVTGKQFAQFQAASIAAGLSLKLLDAAFKDSTGKMKQVGDGLSSVLTATQYGLQTAALLGPKAGLLVGTFDLVINAFSKITTALDERKKDFEQIALDKGHIEAGKQLALDAAAGQVLTTPILDAMQKALVKSGGVIDDQFFKVVSTAIKQVASNPSLIKEAGLKEVTKNLDLTDVLANPQLLRNIATAHTEYTRLNAAIEGGLSISMQQVALYRDLASVGGAANKVLSEILDTFKDVKARDQLRQQEAAINELLNQRSALLRTDIPLFQSEVEVLKERQKVLAQSLDVAGAASKDFKNLAATNPSELGFIGKDAKYNAQLFINNLEKEFNNAGKDGNFNLTKVIDDIVKQSRIDTTFGSEDVIPVGEEEQQKMLKAAQEYISVLQKGTSAEVEKLKVAADLRQALAKQNIDELKIQKDTADSTKAALSNATLALMKLGIDANFSAEDIAKLGELSTSEFNEILKSGGNASESLRNLIQTFAGDNLQQAEQRARISSESFAQEIADLDNKIQEVSKTLAETSGDINQNTGQTRLDLEKELGDLQVERLTKTKEAEYENLRSGLEVIKARAEAEKEAEERAKEAAKALDDLADAEFKLKYGTKDAIQGFNEFVAATQNDLLSQEADAQSQLASAQQEVISSSKSLSDAYTGLKDAVIAFNDSMASAQIEAGLLGIQIETLDGGLNTIGSRVTALNQLFDSTTRDANISLKERINLEKQLATETLQFLQDARNQITNAGLDVFGQSPEQNNQLQQGIQGLQFVADKLGGSFNSFSNFSPQQFDQVSQELLSLPTQFRQNILDALRTLPSTMNIGGFSVEQLQNALGQVGAGINDKEGLPAIADLMAQEKEQLTKLQDLAINDAELQINQVVAANEQVELAKTAFESAQVQADRAAENLVNIQDQLIAENDALLAAADQREKLTSQLLKATDTATIRQIEAQAREFANQIPYFKDISDKLLEVVQAIGGLKESQLSAVANIPSAARGWIPNFAGGRLTTKEAYGLLHAGAREKRMMPSGAGLAVANTSETIIPHRFRGQIPNFATGNGSQIANGIQAINGVNAAVVAAITNSINSIVGRINNNSQQDVDKLTLDKLDNILSTLQDISLSNSTISSAVNVDQATQTTTGAANIQPISINVNTNGRNTVQVTGLDNLERGLREAILKAQTEHADQMLGPINEAVESVFRVLRERGLMSSFGQGQ